MATAPLQLWHGVLVPDYDFRSLSPIDFEEFTRDLLNKELGVDLANYGVGPDGGVDLRDNNRGLVVQCKHRPDASRRALIRAAEAEADKLAGAGVREYLFVTSATMSPGTETELCGALKPLPVSESGIWHRGTLNSALARHEDVERRAVKLWLSSSIVLDQIVSAAQWQRSEELLQRVTDRVRLYVQTQAFRAASDRLNDEHVVLISGPPGAGKSTLAEILLLTLWHQGWTVINIASDIDEAWRHLRSDQRIVFFYDDFLGQTSTAELQKNEGTGLTALIDKIRHPSSNHYLVLTSREQILNVARNGTDDRIRMMLKTQEAVRLELRKIDRFERALMLFNHLYFGFTDPSDREQLASDDRYRQVVDHPGFNPRILESVTLRQRHENVDDFYDAILHALDHPDDIWAGSFAQLSATATKALLQLAVSPYGAMPLDVLQDAVRSEDPREWSSALKVLEGTWIRLIPEKGQARQATLYDPSRRDFLLDLLGQEPYFDSVIDRLSTIGQWLYVCRLGRRVPEAAQFGNPAVSDAVRGLLEDRAYDFDRLTLDIASRHFAAISRAEAAGQKERRSTLGFAYVESVLNGRCDALADLAHVIAAAPVSMPESTSRLRKELELLLPMLLVARVPPDSAKVFRLSIALVTLSTSEWAVEAAMDLADFAFENCTSVDDLPLYAQFPDWFRDGIYQERGAAGLELALSNELEYISQQDDPEVMTTWLDQVCTIAENHGIPLWVDELRNKIDEMPHEDNPVRTGIPRTDPSLTRRGNDEDLRDLFARLSA